MDSNIILTETETVGVPKPQRAFHLAVLAQRPFASPHRTQLAQKSVGKRVAFTTRSLLSQ
jgi:hypothetical protein